MVLKSFQFGSYFSATKVVDDVQTNAALDAAEIQNKVEVGYAPRYALPRLDFEKR